MCISWKNTGLPVGFAGGCAGVWNNSVAKVSAGSDLQYPVNTLWDVVGQTNTQFRFCSKQPTGFFLAWHSWSQCETWSHLDKLWSYKTVFILKILNNCDIKAVYCWVCIWASPAFWSFFSLCRLPPLFALPHLPSDILKQSRIYISLFLSHTSLVSHYLAGSACSSRQRLRK